MSLYKNDRGFGGLVVLVIIIIVAVIGGVIYLSVTEEPNDSDSTPIVSITSTLSPTVNPTEEASNPNCTQTPHNSCITGGIDDALLGSWELTKQTLTSSSGATDNPFSGKTLTFKDDHDYVEDYSTETVPDKTIDNPVMPVTTHCDVSGVLTGVYYASINSNELSLEINGNGGKPTVECSTNTGGTPVTNNTASVSIQKGTATTMPDGSVSPDPYTYSITNNGNTLTITRSNEHTGTTITSIFEKI